MLCKLINLHVDITELTMCTYLGMMTMPKKQDRATISTIARIDIKILLKTDLHDKHAQNEKGIIYNIDECLHACRSVTVNSR